MLTSLSHRGWVLSVAELDRKRYISIGGAKGRICYSLHVYIIPMKFGDVRYQDYHNFIHFSLVSIPDCKQLLVIGGMVRNRGTADVRNINKVLPWDEDNKK